MRAADLSCFGLRVAPSSKEIADDHLWLPRRVRPLRHPHNAEPREPVVFDPSRALAA